MIQSGRLCAIFAVRTEYDEPSGIWMDLLDVQRAKDEPPQEPVPPGTLTDTEWFKADFESAGLYLVFDEPPILLVNQKIMVIGRLWSHRDYWGEYDGGFEMESLSTLAFLT